MDVDTIPVGTYTVIVRFMIDKKGWIKNVLIEKDPGYGLGKRVLKVVSAYKGRWNPEKQNGHPLNSYRRQPVTFPVEDCNKKLQWNTIL